MIDNEGQNNPAALFNTYKLSLTREQQKALAILLPQNYSFQPFKITRSLDEESLKSEPKPHKKKALSAAVKEQKDPDYSASYAPPPPKEAAPLKIEPGPGIPGGEAFQECYLILKKLKKSIYSWPFKVPVDPKALRIPDYFNIVMQPMDLKTIEQNLKKGAYEHQAEFHRDIYKIMMNSYKFNQKNSEVYATTIQFQEEYLKIVRDAKEGKLQHSSNQFKIKHEDNMISESCMNMKDPPQLERAVSASLPLSSKPTRQYNKKDKSEKIEQKVIEKPIENLEKEKQKIEIKKVEEIYEQKHDYVKNQYIDHFFTFQPLSEIHPPIKAQQLYPEISQPKPFFPKKSPAEVKIEKQQIEEPQYSISNQGFKKNKSKLIDRKPRQKKIKKVQILESPTQMKELKQTTQAQSQKTVIYNAIQKRITDLVKKLNEYHMPNKIKPKNTSKNCEGHQHPNFTTFTNITTSQKKKIAEKIFALPPPDLRYVIEICYRGKMTKENDINQYEIDLDKLDGKVLRELFNFINMRIKKIKREPGRTQESTRFQDKQIDQRLEMDEPEPELQQEEEEEEDREEREEEASQHFEEGDNNHAESGSYSNLLGHDQDHGFHDPNYAPVFQMINSDDDHRRHPGDSYSNQFHF